MAQKLSPFVEGKYGWDFGEDGWNTGMDENLLKFSFLFDGNVDSIVSSLQPATSGQSHFLLTDNRLYFSANGQWYSSPTPKWHILTIKETGETFQFDGNLLNPISSQSDVNSRIEAVELVVENLGTAAYKNLDYFATSSQLDVAEANSASYTDSQVLPIQQAVEALEADKGAALVGGAVVSIETISGLRGFEPLRDGQTVELLGYSQRGVGGGVFFHDATSDSADDGGTTIVTSGGSRWVRRDLLPCTPEMYGAVGDGETDDTLAVKKWWESGQNKLSASGNYRISGSAEMLRTVSDGDFFADLRASTFDVVQQRAYLFSVDVAANDVSVFILGGSVNCGNNVARPLDIRPSGEVSAGAIWVKKFTCFDVFANSGLGYSSSAVGVSVSCPASMIAVTESRVDGVNRNYANESIVASTGISVTNVIGSASVDGNVILNVRSPEGDADADGITVFSRDRLLVGRQRVNIKISNNRIGDCKGRFIKLQTTEAEVFGNRMESVSGELIPSFRAIDCQFGGCNIHDNTWNLFAGVTGGSEAVFVLTQFKNQGNWESKTTVRGNFIILERVLRYVVSVSLNGGMARVEALDNFVKTTQSAGVIGETFARMDAASISAVTDASITVSGNTYPAVRDPVLQLVGPFATDSEAAAKIFYEITNNRNTSIPSNKRDVLIEVSGADQVPHINRCILRGNNTGGQHRLNAKSLSVTDMCNGNAFFFGTDGGAGGLLNAPTGYSRFVDVATDGRDVTLSLGASFAKKDASGAWSKYTGVAV